MNSRERIVKAICGQDVDYLPCSIYFNPNLQIEGYENFASIETQTRLAFDLGTDPFIGITFDTKPADEVETMCTREDKHGEDLRILRQVWKTPAGELSQAIKITEDIKSWPQICWDDHAASNIYEPLIKTASDLDALEYIYRPIAEEIAMKSVRDQIDYAHGQGVPVICVYGLGLATAMFMNGAENLVYFAIDNPEAFKRLAEIIHKANLKNIIYAKKAGADVLKRFGGYEMTNFYNPQIFKDVVVPLLRKEVELARELEMPIFYRVVTGMEPLLHIIANIGFDCIEGGEPHLSRCSMQQWHEAFKGKASSWTGISTPAILGGNSTERVREEVCQAVDIFGKKGFILGVTNSIRKHFPWENTLAMIDEWKKLR